MQLTTGRKVKMAINWFQQAASRRFFRFGLPFLVAVVGGSFGLKQFASLRYDFRKTKTISEREYEEYGITMNKKDQKQSLEEICEEQEKMDLDTWENIRGPRPWEDSKTVQDLQRNKTT